MQLKRNKCYYTISGIGEHEQSVKSSVELRISPRFKSTYSLVTNAIVIKKLAHISVNVSSSKQNWGHLENLLLADPSYLANEIPTDIVLGATEHGNIICHGLMKGAKNDTIGQNTHLGWIISGETSTSGNSPIITLKLKIS